MSIISGKVTSLWMWPLPAVGETVPDHPPVDLTEYVTEMSGKIAIPLEANTTYEMNMEMRPEP